MLTGLFHRFTSFIVKLSLSPKTVTKSGAAGETRTLRAFMAQVLSLLAIPIRLQPLKTIDSDGIDPSSSGYQPDALPLSYGSVLRHLGLEPRTVRL